MLLKKILSGKKITAFSILGNNNTLISLDGSYDISGHTLLRFISSEGDFYTSSDSGAEKDISKHILGQKIVKVSMVGNTGDLILSVPAGEIQLICSSGSETSYAVHGPDELDIEVVGGKA